MEGLGLDNLLGAEEVEKLFSNQAETQSEETDSAGNQDTGNQENNEHSDNDEDTAEVDFSDLFGNQPESVGSGEKSEGNGGAPESNDASGTPTTNLFSSIARILRDKGVFPDLSDETLGTINDEAALEKLFNDKVDSMLDERQQRLEKVLNSGATPDEVQNYNQALNLSQFLESRDTYDLLIQEGAKGDDLRKKMMYQDYINRGFSEERAERMITKSFESGTDIEDAKEAFESCKKFYKDIIDDFQKAADNRQKQQKAKEEKQYADLKKHLLDTESFYDGVKVDKVTRQKAYDLITKPVFKDEQGYYLTALQQYQREHPMEFMENVALVYALTDGFKTVEKMTKTKVNAGLKKGFAELESVLNSTRKGIDGKLDLANGSPDDSERENWTLA